MARPSFRPRAASQRRASTAFWCALAAGLIGSGCAALGAYPAALTLDEPEVTGLVIVGGMTLFLVAVGSTSHALLQRSMSFGVIQTAVVIGSLTSTACAITAAALGAGAWALVLQQVVLAAVTSLFFILPARWVPSLEFSRADMRSLSRFAFPYTGASVFFLLQQVVAALFIGHFVGIDALGIWNLSLGDRLGAAVAARSADRARDLRRVRTTAREPGAGGGHVVEGSHPARRRRGSPRSSASSR